MKNIVIYISLLIFSGLILPFYGNIALKKAPQIKVFQATEKTIFDQESIDQSLISVYQDIAEILLPVLKIKKIL